MSATKKGFPPWALHFLLVPITVATLYPALYVIKLALSGTGGASASPWPWPETFSLDAFSAVVGHKGSDGSWLQSGKGKRTRRRTIRQRPENH